MAYTTDTGTHMPSAWWEDTYGDNGIPGTSAGSTHQCPWTGETIKRITVCAPSNRNYYLEYPCSEPFSKDSTYLRVNSQAPGYGSYAVKLSDYSFARTLESATSQMAYFWDRTDDDKIWVVDNPFLKRIGYQMISTGTVTWTLDLTTYVPLRYSGQITRLDVGEQQLSNDGNYICVKATHSSGEVMLCIDLAGNRVCAELYYDDLPANTFDVHLMPSSNEWHVSVIPGGWRESWSVGKTPTGDPGDTAALIYSWELDPQAGNGHNAKFVGPDGGSYVIWQQGNGNNHIYRADMENGGNATLLYEIGWFPQNWPAASGWDSYFTAPSAVSDGWVYYSSFPGAITGDPSLGWRSYIAEICRFKYDGTGPIQRMFHHRATSHGYDPAAATPPDYKEPYIQDQYWSYPKINVNRAGTLLAFNSCFMRRAQSDWYTTQAGYNDYTDVYLHEIDQTPGGVADGTYLIKLG